MFLHKQERIESLVFICMLALLVFSILEMLTKRAGIFMTGGSILLYSKTSKDFLFWLSRNRTLIYADFVAQISTDFFGHRA